MRAVALDADGLPELAELPEPTGPGELVEVLACGLCGSDVEKLGHARAGTVLGHEVEGSLADGTRVAVLHRVPCGSCDRCLAGHASTCEAFAVSRIAPGGFAERLTATHYETLPGTLGEHDGIWVEPLACILRAAELVPADGPVLIVGCGAIGLLWAQVLLSRGRTVVVADVQSDRLNRALELGGVVNAEHISSAVVTAYAGVDDALARLEPGGKLIVFAATAAPVAVSLDRVYRNELTLAGSRSASPKSFGEAVRLLPHLALPPVTVLPLERFAEGVDLYTRGAVLKVAFTP